MQYDDGEHEWINLREEQDRVMIFYATEDLDGDGIIDDNDRVWLEFRFCRDPDAALQTLEAPSFLSSVTDSAAALEDGDIHGHHYIDNVDDDNLDEWVEYIDEATQEPYFYNQITGETRYTLE